MFLSGKIDTRLSGGGIDVKESVGTVKLNKFIDYSHRLRLSLRTCPLAEDVNSRRRFTLFHAKYESAGEWLCQCGDRMLFSTLKSEYFYSRQFSDIDELERAIYDCIVIKKVIYWRLGCFSLLKNIKFAVFLYY